MVRRAAIALLFLPAALLAQAAYKDSVFSPGADEGSPPLNVSQKFQIHAVRMIKPRVFVGNLFIAGIQQWENSPGQWGRGWDGFGKRYGNDLARNTLREVLGAGLDVAAHQDPRFFRSSETRFRPRLRHALMQVVIARTDTGGRSFAYGTVLGTFASAEIASVWMPERQSTIGDGLVYGALVLAGDAGRNVFREFWPDIRRKLKKH